MSVNSDVAKQSPILGRDKSASPRVLIVSASDSKYFFLLRGLIGSMQTVLDRPDVKFGCFDLGLTAQDLAWLGRYDAQVVSPGVHFGLGASDYSVVLRSFLVRPFLPEYFPGYDIYLWVDSDVWFQGETAILDYIDGAARDGIAVAHEREKAYQVDTRLFAWSVKHAILGGGLLDGIRLVSHPQINAGIFAISGEAPHWDAWARAYELAISRTGKLAPYDQVALNFAVYGAKSRKQAALPSKLLRPEWNWICRRGVPMWHDDKRVFCKPYTPYESIHAVHLAGIGKHSEYTVRRTGGGSFKTMIVLGSSPENPILVSQDQD